MDHIKQGTGVIVPSFNGNLTLWLLGRSRLRALHRKNKQKHPKARRWIPSAPPSDTVFNLLMGQSSWTAHIRPVSGLWSLWNPEVEATLNYLRRELTRGQGLKFKTLLDMGAQEEVTVLIFRAIFRELFFNHALRDYPNHILYSSEALSLLQILSHCPYNLLNTSISINGFINIIILKMTHHFYLIFTFKYSMKN